MPLSFSLEAAEKAFLSRQARMAVEARLTGRAVPMPLPPSPMPTAGKARQCPDTALHRHLGAFVTLTLSGGLRGCIGNIVGREPLYALVWHMAQAAAFNDPRFPPVTLPEWTHMHVEISVLDTLTPCPNPEAVEVGRHGLVLEFRGQSGVFLPQVPVEQGWDRQAYLDNLCRKAGLPAGTWKLPEARLYWYEALAFPSRDS